MAGLIVVGFSRARARRPHVARRGRLSFLLAQLVVGMAESMLAELAILERQLEEDQTSLKRIVFGASSSDEPVPDQLSSSQIIRSGSQWTGTLGYRPYHLVFCWREESWLEAVGIYPGEGASRIEGDISVSQVRAVPQPRGPRACVVI